MLNQTMLYEHEKHNNLCDMSMINQVLLIMFVPYVFCNINKEFKYFLTKRKYMYVILFGVAAASLLTATNLR